MRDNNESLAARFRRPIFDKIADKYAGKEDFLRQNHELKQQQVQAHTSLLRRNLADNWDRVPTPVLPQTPDVHPKPVRVKKEREDGFLDPFLTMAKMAGNAYVELTTGEVDVFETYPGERKAKREVDSHYMYDPRPSLSASQKQKPWDGDHLPSGTVIALEDDCHGQTIFTQPHATSVNHMLGTTVEEAAQHFVNSGLTETIELPSESSAGKGTVTAFCHPETKKNLQKFDPSHFRHWLRQTFYGCLESHVNVEGMGYVRKEEIINTNAQAIKEKMKEIPDPNVVWEQKAQANKAVQQEMESTFRDPWNFFGQK